MIRGVIFDLGSTLIRFEGNWDEVLDQARQALVEALRQHGVGIDPQAFSAEFHRQMQAYYHERETEFIEFSTAYVLRTVLANFGHPDVPGEVVRRALRQMYAVSEAHWQPMPDAYTVLDGLQHAGYRLGLISNAGDEDNVQRLIDHARLRPYFDPVIVSAGIGLRKPNPAVFRGVLKAWRLRPREVVMVGDTLGADILGAQNAGLHQIWLTAQADSPGNRAHAGTITPEATAQSLAEVPDLIQQLGHRQLRRRA
ncbi:MAG: HAD family hydrolase [Chloroflexota bacterium]